MAMKQSGHARFTNFDAYLGWYKGLKTADDADAAYKMLRDRAAPCREPYKPNPTDRAIEKMFQPQGGYGGSLRPRETAWEETHTKVLARILQFHTLSSEFDQPIQVGRWVDDSYAFLYMGNPEQGIIVPDPEAYLEHVLEEDLSGVTPAQLRERLSVPTGAEGRAIVPADFQGTLTTAGLSARLEEHESGIRELEQEKEAIKKAKTGELAGIQAQIEALQATLDEKKRTLMAQLEEKMSEMEAMKENLENQIYLLDSQLYAIRCYAGEVVRFARLRKGKNAPDAEPIVIYQKLRFLDEDLGRIASLYELQWEDMDMFEAFLQHHPLALETFAPNERCVMLVRLSRNASTFAPKSDAPYSNMLDVYNYYHGKTVGIIIRNGENLYLGWTDQDRVHIDDDLILSNVVTDISPEEPKEFLFESARKQWEQEQKKERKRLLDGFISRSFVYNILQGIVDNSALLPLPEGVKLDRQSEYVIYSTADKALTDNRFGSFTNILALCNNKVMEGDWLLTVQRLVPERQRGVFGGWVSNTWENPRGRGERNRTRDCHVEDCKLYPANLVEYEEPVDYVRYRIRRGTFPDGSPYYHGPYVTRADEELDHMAEILGRFTRQGRHVFVSVPKESSGWRGTVARANFELMDGEFINLTYLNSVWLQWVITNSKLGSWTIGGKAVDYAYAIRYLKTAMDHIRKREEEERALISAVDPDICNDADWPLKLTQWKLDKQVRAITPYQAKRFAKAYPGLDGDIPIQKPEDADA